MEVVQGCAQGKLRAKVNSILMNIADHCTSLAIGICWVPAQLIPDPVFGFAEYVGALALLAVVYTVTDIRYRFRLQSAPIPLGLVTYILTAFIGASTLISDVWSRNGWLVPQSSISYATWQGVLGALFLILILTWLWYAFIRPPVFGPTNYKQYAQALYRIVVRGSETELAAIADELRLSVKPLLRTTLPRQRRRVKQEVQEMSAREKRFRGYAHDVLLLIGDRKLCRNLVKSAPNTAIALFETAVELGQFHAPISQFARNVSTEAILNEDSNIYHEDEGYEVGLLGYIKPFSRAVYGHYRLVEGIGDGALSISYKVTGSWNSRQYAAYVKCALVTVEAYLTANCWGLRSQALIDAVRIVKGSLGDTHKLGQLEESYRTEPFQRLQTTLDFVREALDLLGKQNPVPQPRTEGPADRGEWDLYDYLADLALETIWAVSRIEGPNDTWHIHYGMVYSTFFKGFGRDNTAWDTFQYKLIKTGLGGDQID